MTFFLITVMTVFKGSKFTWGFWLRFKSYGVNLSRLVINIRHSIFSTTLLEKSNGVIIRI